MNINKRKLPEYYFRDINDNTLYCVFSREAAMIFYPRLDEVDPGGKHEVITKTLIMTDPKSSPDVIKEVGSMQLFHQIMPKVDALQLFRANGDKENKENNGAKEDKGEEIDIIKVPTNIIIIDKGVKLTFGNPNYSVEIKTFYPSLC